MATATSLAATHHAFSVHRAMAGSTDFDGFQVTGGGHGQGMTMCSTSMQSMLVTKRSILVTKNI